MTGSAALMALAEEAPESRVVLLGREPHPPYERPPLSKDLWGEESPDLEAIVHDRELFGGAELVLGREAVRLDPVEHTVVDDRGESWRYGTLLLATGARVRQPPLGRGVVRTFRTLEDFQRLHADLRPGLRVLIVGAGFIGSELAAALRGRDAEVTMVFPEADVGALTLPEPLARAVGTRYRAEGVRTLAGESLAGVEAGRPHVARTRGGTVLEADVIVAGLGVEPETALARAAGLDVDDGIVVDELMHTSAPDVFAAGDVARFPAPELGRMRVEHEEHAKLQGMMAGANLAGAGHRYEHLPMVYSDLFDWGYQAVGRLDGRGEAILVGFGLARPHAAAPGERAPVDATAPGIAYYGAGGRVQGVLLWNLHGHLETARGLIRARARFDADALHTAIPLGS